MYSVEINCVLVVYHLSQPMPFTSYFSLSLGHDFPSLKCLLHLIYTGTLQHLLLTWIKQREKKRKRCMHFYPRGWMKCIHIYNKQTKKPHQVNWPMVICHKNWCNETVLLTYISNVSFIQPFFSPFVLYMYKVHTYMK